MITEYRPHYKPFEYQIAFDFFKDQHRVHWLATLIYFFNMYNKIIL